MSLRVFEDSEVYYISKFYYNVSGGASTLQGDRSFVSSLQLCKALSNQREHFC